MTQDQSDISIGQFALKEVKFLKTTDTLADAIQMMQQLGIRHIPILQERKVVGVVNPGCVLKSLQKDISMISFDATLSTLMCPKYNIVSKDTSLFEVVEIISNDPLMVVLIEEDNNYVGIYTELDILDTDFLWTQFNDLVFRSDSSIGTPINEFTCVTNENVIYQTIQFMNELHQDFIGLIDAESKQLRGVLSFLDIVNHLHYTSFQQKREIRDIMSKSVFSIFPSSGLYMREPVLLTNMRREMYINDEYFATILDEVGIPTRIVSIHEIIAYLVRYSDYFG